MKFHIVLHQPRIPQNTGNIGRLCYASNTSLHLIHPLGFFITQKELKRAGMDYWNNLKVYEWNSYNDFLLSNLEDIPHYFLTTKATKEYYFADMRNGAYLHFGREDAGLDEVILKNNLDRCFKIPMYNDARSLNLSTSAGIVLYEGIRQINFL